MTGTDQADALGCRITIDVARDGRRFAGPRAAAVLRTVAARLRSRLPDGAHLGADDRDGLWLELPGMANGSAASWMHRTLPGLLDDLSLDHDLARLHLRSVVSDASGPVGAQLLVRLEQVRPRAGASPSASNPVGDGGQVAPAASTCGCPTESALGSTAAATGGNDLPPASPPNGMSHASPAGLGVGTDMPIISPGDGADPEPDIAPRGRHHAADREPFRPSVGPPSNGSRRHRRDQETSRSIDPLDRVVDLATGRATELVSDRPTDLAIDRVVDLATGRATELVTDRATDQAADRVADQAAERKSYQPGHRPCRTRTTNLAAERATELATERATDRATNQATESATELATERATNLTTEQATDRAIDRTTDRALDRTTDRALDRTTDRATDGAKDPVDDPDNSGPERLGLADLLAGALAAYRGI